MSDSIFPKAINGYAPVENADHMITIYEKIDGGLTKRELFAAIAMHAHIAANLGHDFEVKAGDMARGALVCADALIEALDE